MLRFGIPVLALAMAACTAIAPTTPPADPSDPLRPGASLGATQPPSDRPTHPPTDSYPPIAGANLLISEGVAPAPAVTADAVAALARGNADFALDLYRALAAGNTDNLVLGPHSISSALAMVYAGARGDMAHEMADVLHYGVGPDALTSRFGALDQALRSRNEEGAVDLRLANQAFASPGWTFLDSYLATLGRDFGAPMAELEFGDAERARGVINDWAADRTNDRITELFPPGSITGDTALVLANTVSLDAAWTYLFDPAQTTTEPFELPTGNSIKVPTMHFDLFLPLAEEKDFQAVELPYGSGDLSMVVVLPKDLDRFDADVDAERLESMFGAIRERGIHLSLPKFSFKLHTALDETLRDLGMTSAYDPALADFSGMTGNPDLFLDTVQHEAFIEVDEEGTEAHAATGAGMAASHGPTITVDRPFFFVIRDRVTGAILFLGRVTDPSS